MAADQRNMQLFTYVDNNGVSWNKRGKDDANCAAVDGHATFGTHPSWGRETTRHSVRKMLYVDPTTFRTKVCIMYTAAAAAAVAVGTDNLAVHVEGETATVNYLAAGLIPERQPKVKAARQLADHA